MSRALVATHKFNNWRDRVTWYTHRTIVPRILRAAGRPLLGLVMKFEATGFENIPSGPCILAPNHINNFDVVTLGLYLPRHPFYMTKRELFNYPFLSWIIRLSGAFPVGRGESDAWAMAHASRVLQAGQMLCIFPEGTRSGPKAQLGRGKSGAVQLALKHKVPLIPAAILGTQHVKIGQTRPKVTLQIGDPLDITALAGPPPHAPATVRELTKLLMQRVAAMLPPEHRGRYV